MSNHARTQGIAGALKYALANELTQLRSCDLCTRYAADDGIGSLSDTKTVLISTPMVPSHPKYSVCNKLLSPFSRLNWYAPDEISALAPSYLMSLTAFTQITGVSSRILHERLGDAVFAEIENNNGQFVENHNIWALIYHIVAASAKKSPDIRKALLEFDGVFAVGFTYATKCFGQSAGWTYRTNSAWNNYKYVLSAVTCLVKTGDIDDATKIATVAKAFCNVPVDDTVNSWGQTPETISLILENLKS